MTSVTLAAIGGLHVAWGRGSSFPFSTRDELANAVAGRSSTPSPAACNTVAGLCFAAAGLVADIPIGRRRWRAAGRAGVATVLATRGIVGFAGRTDMLSRGSTSPTFRRLDRCVYAPLCLALAIGAATAGRRSRAAVGEI